MPLRFVVGNDRVVVGDEKKRRVPFPEFYLVTKRALNLFRLTLAEPRREQKLDTTDDEKGLVLVFADQRKEVAHREGREPGGKRFVRLKTVEHIEMKAADHRGDFCGVGALRAQIGRQEQRPFVA